MNFTGENLLILLLTSHALSIFFLCSRTMTIICWMPLWLSVLPYTAKVQQMTLLAGLYAHMCLITPMAITLQDGVL